MIYQIWTMIVVLSSYGNCKSVVGPKKIDHSHVGVELMSEENLKKEGRILKLISDYSISENINYMNEKMIER